MSKESRVDERHHHFGRPDHDYHTRDDEQMRHAAEMAEQAHRMHEEMRERLEDQMQHTREIMEQARERFIELSVSKNLKKESENFGLRNFSY